MRVGITGHQTLRPATAWTWVTVAMRTRLLELPEPVVGVTSLAVGADQLFARLVLERGGTLHVVLPFHDIERSFSNRDRPFFHQLRAQAGSVEVVRPAESDEEAYLAAGQRVADISDLLFAVWDGRPARGKGGTADVVAYAKQRRVPIAHFNPVSEEVCLIRD